MAVEGKKAKKYLELFIVIYGKERFYDMIVYEKLQILDYFKKYPIGGT